MSAMTSGEVDRLFFTYSEFVLTDRVELPSTATFAELHFPLNAECSLQFLVMLNCIVTVRLHNVSIKDYDFEGMASLRALSLENCAYVGRFPSSLEDLEVFNVPPAQQQMCASAALAKKSPEWQVVQWQSIQSLSSLARLVFAYFVIDDLSFSTTKLTHLVLNTISVLSPVLSLPASLERLFIRNCSFLEFNLRSDSLLQLTEMGTTLNRTAVNCFVVSNLRAAAPRRTHSCVYFNPYP
jgi:hypothetical protein